jgi:alpha-L-fucosidase 2
VGFRGGDDRPWQVDTEGTQTLVMSGDARETRHSDGNTGVSFYGLMRVMNEGGKVSAGQGDIRVEKAHAVTILIAIHTDYRGKDPQKASQQQIDRAVAKSYRGIKADHIADHTRSSEFQP